MPVPDDNISNRPFDNRTNSPSGISEIKNLDIKQSSEIRHDQLFGSSPTSPSHPFPSNSRKRPQPDTNPVRSPERTESETIRQSRATAGASQGADDYWRGTSQFQRTLFDPDRDSPMSKADTTTTRVYDPRTHIFRSKKAFETKPGLSTSS